MQTALAVREGSLVYKTHKGLFEDQKPLHRGISLFWSQWDETYWNYSTIDQLKLGWGVDFVRLPIGSHEHAKGYQEDMQGNLDKAFLAIDAALSLGLYVIVDCHDHHAVQNVHLSSKLLYEVARKYGNNPGILYEVVNEPLDVSWEEIRSYAEFVVPLIRSKAPDAICIVGTPQWCRDFTEVRSNPLLLKDIMYTYHFYAESHREDCRHDLEDLLRNDFPIFVSECGASDHKGQGDINYREFDKWLDLLEGDYRVPWCAWALNDKEESSSLLVKGTKPEEISSVLNMTDYGIFIRSRTFSPLKKLPNWSPYRAGMPSPYAGGREEEKKKVESLMKRNVSIPVSLLEDFTRSIFFKLREEPVALYILWLSQNWRLIDLETRNRLALVIREKYDTLLKDPQPGDEGILWSMKRMVDTIVYMQKRSVAG
jgi:endoglucanase